MIERWRAVPPMRQIVPMQGGHVLIADAEVFFGRFDQSVDQAQQLGLSRAPKV